MAKAPWYLNQAAPGLKHQKNSRPAEQTAGLDQWYVRGQKAGPTATKFRKGACPNCGALTHALQDCLDRPRVKGAKWTNADIRPDEHLARDLKLKYDGKRDRFAGFDLGQHEALVAVKFKAEEEARRAHVHTQKLAELDAADAANAADGGGDARAREEQDDDGLRVREDEEVVAAREGGGTRQGAHKMSVRNLRIREDTAKYLLNLDTNSAYYDPKTRAMRDNPRPDQPMGTADDADAGGAFVGDNFVRHRGQTLELFELQQFTSAAYEKGQELHLNAEPTQVEMMNKLFREKKAALAASKQTAVLDKYGGEKHLQPVDPRLLLAQSENYTEYDRSGRMRDREGGAAAEAKVVRSRYAEDVLHANHTAVWGSFFDRATLRWGYADDGSTLKHSYSTGEAGRRAREIAAKTVAAGMGGPTRAEILASERAGADDGAPAADDEAAARAARAERAARVPTRTLYGIGEGLASAELDGARLQAALARERERQELADGGGGGAGTGGGGAQGGTKRGYNSMAADSVTAEDMEAYYMRKRRADDPMAQMADTVGDA